MIISRAPFRITLAGGGTDLPAFYEKYGGAVTSMGIDKYIYVSFKRNVLDPKVRLQYLKTEYVDKVSQLEHDRAKAALSHFNILNQCEISSMADLPSQTGLGSSGSYLVALINCLQAYGNRSLGKYSIADLACKIEMEDLNEPVGKQDQFIASYGGIHTFTIDRNGAVTPERLHLTPEEINNFVERCRIYYTGYQRSASEVLESQTQNRGNFETQMRKIRDLGHHFIEALRARNFNEYGALLDDHWRFKKKLSTKMSNPAVDTIYSELKQEKLILGGKLIGAGGGGFLMVYVPEEFDKVDEYMRLRGLPRLDYKVDDGGVRTLYTNT